MKKGYGLWAGQSGLSFLAHNYFPYICLIRRQSMSKNRQIWNFRLFLTCARDGDFLQWRFIINPNPSLCSVNLGYGVFRFGANYSFAWVRVVEKGLISLSDTSIIGGCSSLGLSFPNVHSSFLVLSPIGDGDQLALSLLRLSSLECCQGLLVALDWPFLMVSCPLPPSVWPRSLRFLFPIPPLSINPHNHL